MVRVYLAGNVYATEYRSQVKRDYSHKIEAVDPITENGAIVNTTDKTIKHIKTFDEIVENDKALIDTCKILVAYVDKYTAGTMMELIYAFNRNIPVYVIVPQGQNFANDIWIQYHTTKFFFNIDDCFNHILKQIK